MRGGDAKNENDLEKGNTDTDTTANHEDVAVAASASVASNDSDEKKSVEGAFGADARDFPRAGAAKAEL